jgi:hypothetical protein
VVSLSKQASRTDAGNPRRLPILLPRRKPESAGARLEAEQISSSSPPQQYLLRRRRLLLPPSLGKEALALLGLYLFATKNRIDSNPLGSRSASLAVCSQGCRAAGAVVAPSSAASAHRILAVRFHTGSGEQIGGLLSRCPAFDAAPGGSEGRCKLESVHDAVNSTRAS